MEQQVAAQVLVAPVPKHFLYGRHMSPAREQMGGKSAAEVMEGELMAEPLSVFAGNRDEGCPLHPGPTARPDKECCLSTVPADEFRARLTQIGTECPHGRMGERHHPFPAPLAVKPDGTVLQIEREQVQRGDLAQAGAGGIGRFQNGAVAQRNQALSLDAGQELMLRFLPPCDTRAHVRVWVVVFSLGTSLSVKKIASLMQISRSTVFAYRKLFEEQGVAGLLARTKRGRPPKRLSPALEEKIVDGLNLLHWLHLPTLREWLRHHGLTCPDWILRRRVRELIAHSGYDYLLNHPEAKRRTGPPPPPKRPKASEPDLNLVVEDSPGLRPWSVFTLSIPKGVFVSYLWEHAETRVSRIFPDREKSCPMTQTELPLAA